MNSHDKVIAMALAKAIAMDHGHAFVAVAMAEASTKAVAMVVAVAAVMAQRLLTWQQPCPSSMTRHGHACGHGHVPLVLYERYSWGQGPL